MGRKRRTDKELVTITFDLQHEIEMLIWTAGLLQNGGFVSANYGPIKMVQIALLDSFRIHARNLIAFLYPDSPKGDVVIAEDFFDNKSAWSGAPPRYSAFLKSTYKRAHKEVAHLSYARLGIPPSTRGWEFLKIKHEILEALRVFFQIVPKKRVCDDFKTMMAQLVGTEGVTWD